jgi:membrane-bound acyltransferase YfiQ involved in biofilm formation
MNVCTMYVCVSMYACTPGCVRALAQYIYIYMFVLFLIFLFPSHAISELPLQFIKQFKI